MIPIVGQHRRTASSTDVARRATTTRALHPAAQELSFVVVAALPAASSDFVDQGGVATIAYRLSRKLDMWAGVGVANPVNGPSNVHGPRTLTMMLDLTPAGGYDGVGNFGTVSWSDSILGDLGSYTYASNIEFNWILISSRSAASGTISTLLLEQLNHQGPLTLHILPRGNSYIRNDKPDVVEDTSKQFILGRVSGDNWIRSLLAFDLTVIPDHAVINSVALDLYIDIKDVGTSTGWVGSQGVTLNEIIQDASFPANHTWNEYNDSGNLAWSSPGGDFSATVLSRIIDIDGAPTNPDSVNAGDNFRFESTDDFISAIQSNLVDNMVQFILRAPSIETSYNTRKLYRFASQSNPNPAYIPVLSVDFSFPQPLTGTVILVK
ncbi:MAG: hypothetical protein PHO37_07075 [Kiritimatiellae bacterium]|nr:hypothetical protein [Kiritimatiellia bacterium]